MLGRSDTRGGVCGDCSSGWGDEQSTEGVVEAASDKADWRRVALGNTFGANVIFTMILALIVVLTLILQPLVAKVTNLRSILTSDKVSDAA